MYIKVTATPGAKKETITMTGDRAFSITVKEPAERNLANDRIRELIALHFLLPVAQVRIITGHRSRSKILSISNP